jgi:hypothetical protein
MSYDLNISVRTASGELFNVQDLDGGHITYNVSEMLTELGIKGEDSNEAFKVTDWKVMLNHAIKELENDLERYEVFNSPNGWGTAEGVLEALKLVRKDLDGYFWGYTDKYLNKIVDDLYISWH